MPGQILALTHVNLKINFINSPSPKGRGSGWFGIADHPVLLPLGEGEREK